MYFLTTTRSVSAAELLNTSASLTLRVTVSLVCLVAMSAQAPPLFAAPPKLNYVFPPGAQRGQTITVAANGSWDTWPVSAWVDRPGLQFTAELEKGKCKVTVDAA